MVRQSFLYIACRITKGKKKLFQYIYEYLKFSQGNIQDRSTFLQSHIKEAIKTVMYFLNAEILSNITSDDITDVMMILID